MKHSHQLALAWVVFITWRLLEYFGRDSVFFDAHDPPGDAVGCARPLLGSHFFGDFQSVLCQSGRGAPEFVPGPIEQTPALLALTSVVPGDFRGVGLGLMLVFSVTLLILVLRLRTALSASEIAFIATSGPVLWAVDRGNFSWVIIAAIFTYVAFASAANWRTVFALAVAISLKPLLLPAAVLLALRLNGSRLAVLTRMLVAAILVTILGAVKIGWRYPEMLALIDVWTGSSLDIRRSLDTPLIFVLWSELQSLANGSWPWTGNVFLLCGALAGALALRLSILEWPDGGTKASGQKTVAAAVFTAIIAVPPTYGLCTMLPLVAPLVSRRRAALASGSTALVTIFYLGPYVAVAAERSGVLSPHVPVVLAAAIAACWFLAGGFTRPGSLKTWWIRDSAGTRLRDK